MTVPPLVTWLVLMLCGSAWGATADAESLLRHGQIPAALAAATEQARANPTDLAAQELYVDLLLAVGMTGRAEQEMRERAKLAPTDPDAHYLVGRAEVDPADAQAAYEAALRLDPDHARAHMGMGSIHEAKGRAAEAEAAYARAVKLDRGLGEAWVGQARVRLRTGRKAEALESARAGLAAVPDEPALALMVAELAPADARATLEAAIRQVPDEPRLHQALAATLLAAGDARGAQAAARAALRIDPSAREAARIELFANEAVDGRLDAAGRAALEEARALEVKDAKAALARYPALAQRYPRSALVLLGRSAARRATGDRAGALEDLVSAIQLDPTNVETQAVCGLALLEVGRAAEAEPLLSAASSARPWDPALGLARFRALRETGRGAEADRLLAEFAVLHRFDPSVQAAHAAALAAAGRPEDAYRVVRTALVVVPTPELAALFVQIAPAAGHPEEAAALLEQIVAQTGNAQLAEAAKQLRER